ncbi:Uncharacterised protein [Vibrio cholerae]|nr:Uncharacterised protein [Vibrio cholerae]CSI32484.1 Uncharacterised protein [Vibrio cholerae]CSI68692.1 Uncharacterised protein [Vibrio cholerae]
MLGENFEHFGEETVSMEHLRATQCHHGLITA